MKDTILAWKFKEASKRRIACRIGDQGYIDSKHARVIHLIPRKPSGDTWKFQTVGQTLCGIPIAMIQLAAFDYTGNYKLCARCAVSWHHNPNKKKEDRLIRIFSAKSAGQRVHHHTIGRSRTMCGKKIKVDTWEMGFGMNSTLCLKCEKSRK